MAMRVAIVGGTGSFGRALAERIASVGEPVVIGSRDATRAKEIAATLGVEGATNEEAVRNSDLVILAVRSNAALDTARELAQAIGTTPLLSVASNLEFVDGGVLPGQHGDSLAELIAEIVDAPVAAGLQTLAAVHLAGSEPPDEDVLVCGNDSAAKDLSLGLAGRLVKGRAIDAGPLANARALEGMTAVILNVNRRYKVHAGIRVTGLD
jgi:8-hydroxy-5-deazaflavin:NADPH oxidoreductase